jgi:hypothetical protein
LGIPKFGNWGGSEVFMGLHVRAGKCIGSICCLRDLYDPVTCVAVHGAGIQNLGSALRYAEKRDLPTTARFSHCATDRDGCVVTNSCVLEYC